jgi:hypothetical protein
VSAPIMSVVTIGAPMREEAAGFLTRATGYQST